MRKRIKYDNAYPAREITVLENIWQRNIRLSQFMSLVLIFYHKLPIDIVNKILRMIYHRRLAIDCRQTSIPGTYEVEYDTCYTSYK